MFFVKGVGNLLLLCRNVDKVWLNIAKWIGLVDYKADDFKES